MTRGGYNEYVISFILMQLVLKLVRKLKASLWVQIFPNVLLFGPSSKVLCFGSCGFHATAKFSPKLSGPGNSSMTCSRILC